jgi:hypothetical protein
VGSGLWVGLIRLVTGSKPPSEREDAELLQKLLVDPDEPWRSDP